MLFPHNFGRYRLIRKIASGGMAEVYEARLTGLRGFEKSLAIKCLLPQWSDRDDFEQMLVDEAKILVGLDHPNIVQVYELGNEAGRFYLAMELVDGIDLRDLQRACQLRGQTIPLELSVWIVHEVAEALAYAQEIALIHRDISPQNILLSSAGQVKVTDFGIAKVIGQSHETVSKSLKGKLAYMSPEQIRMEALDQRSDLFSLGIVLYELLTGQRLFAADNELALLEQVKTASVSFDSPVFASVPSSLIELLRATLAQKRDDRPASAADFLERIDVIGQKSAGARRRDLSSFVKELYPKQTLSESAPIAVEALLDETRSQIRLTDQTRVLVTSWNKQSRKKLRVSLFVVLLMFSSLLAYSLYRRQHQVVVDPAFFEQVLEESEAYIPEEDILVPEEEKTSVQKSGALHVQATPWGHVYIDKEKKRYTSPLKSLSLSLGSHHVHVIHPPTGQRYERRIDVRAGKTVTCVADFRTKKGMKCY
jgi:serine/threonine protein kinase